MEPFTAALILGVVMSGTQFAMGIQAQKAQANEIRRAQADRVAAQEVQTRREMGVQAQRTNTALAGAANRQTSATKPSYAATQANMSVLGGLPSLNTAPSNNTAKSITSGTF